MKRDNIKEVGMLGKYSLDADNYSKHSFKKYIIVYGVIFKSHIFVDTYVIVHKIDLATTICKLLIHP